jgi:hypothetical protein
MLNNIVQVSWGWGCCGWCSCNKKYRICNLGTVRVYTNTIIWYQTSYGTVPVLVPVPCTNLTNKEYVLYVQMTLFVTLLKKESFRYEYLPVLSLHIGGVPTLSTGNDIVGESYEYRCTSTVDRESTSKI